MQYQRFCTRCGAPLDGSGRCPQCSGQNGAANKKRNARVRRQPRGGEDRKRLLLVIAALLAALLLLAAVILILHLRGSGGRAQDDPDATEEAPETFDPEVSYASVVEDCSYALRRIEQGASADDLEGDLNPLLQPWIKSGFNYREGEAYSYAFYDVNGDGVEEMLIGRKNENQDDIVIVDVLVWRDGAPARLCEPYETKELTFSSGFIPFGYLISEKGEIAFDFGWNIDYCSMICGTISESGTFLVREGLFGFYSMSESAAVDFAVWAYYLLPCDDPAMSYGQFIDEYLGRAPEDGERLDYGQHTRNWGWDYYSIRFELIEPDWRAF